MGKIIGRVLMAFFALSLCGSLMKATQPSYATIQSRNIVATANARLSGDPYSSITQTALKRNIKELGKSFSSLQAGTPVEWSRPDYIQASVDAYIQTEYGRPTSTPRPASSNDNSTNSDSASIEDTPDDVIFRVTDFVDMQTLVSIFLNAGLVWIVTIISTFIVLYMLNSLAGVQIKNATNLINNKTKQTTSRLLLFIYGLGHWVIIFGFYSGVILCVFGFTLFILHGNRVVESNVVEIILLILTISSWFFVMAGIIRGVRAFHKPDGHKHYLLLPNEAPELFRLLATIADKLNVSAITEVRIVPNTQLEMYQRGLWLPLPIGKRERVLVVGMAGLQQMSVEQFTALVTAQYQSLQPSISDIGTGVLVLRGRDNMRRMIERMLEIKYDNRFNFIWYSFLLFQNLYLSATDHIVQLHHLLVDMRVAPSYEHYHEAIVHLNFMTEVYNLHSAMQIRSAVQNQYPAFNLYQTMFLDEEELEQSARQLDMSLPYPPKHSDRYAPTWIRLQALDKKIPELSADMPENKILSLFKDADGLMQKMTILKMQTVAKHRFKRVP